MLLISALMSLTSCFYDKYHVRRDWSHLLRGPNPGPKRCLVNWTTSVLEQHMRYFYTLGPQNLSVLGLDGFCSHFSIPYWDESLAAASPSPPSLPLVQFPGERQTCTQECPMALPRQMSFGISRGSQHKRCVSRHSMYICTFVWDSSVLT